ncbi:hypothetical protein EJ06DRAFT_520019 [Trichodelitschia bisporula]|uniref:Uncharacterized protein n=1 Tax=Trichodelitschia bisporula TaxID=703511 RepID=A0A6G1I458_9PEZI|nr:hypothetical protein EJ06DRAFT_520019 [Trichodelitschia bisporula]
MHSAETGYVSVTAHQLGEPVRSISRVSFDDSSVLRSQVLGSRPHWRWMGERGRCEAGGDEKRSQRMLQAKGHSAPEEEAQAESYDEIYRYEKSLGPDVYELESDAFFLAWDRWDRFEERDKQVKENWKRRVWEQNEDGLDRHELGYDYIGRMADRFEFTESVIDAIERTDWYANFKEAWQEMEEKAIEEEARRMFRMKARIGKGVKRKRSASLGEEVKRLRSWGHLM